MTAVSLFENPYFIGYVGGPIAGIIYASLFGNIEVKKQDIQKNWTAHVQTSSPQASGRSMINNSDDFWLFLTFSFVAIVVSAFFIILYYEPTSKFIIALSIFLSLFTTLSVVTNFISSREINFSYVILLIVSIFVFFLVNDMANNTLLPYVNYANSLAGRYSLKDVSAIINTIYAFYNGLTAAQIFYFLLLVAAYVLIACTAIVAFFRLLFYSMAAKVGSQPGQYAWKLIVFTHKFSGARYLWFMIFSVLFAFLTFKGETFIYGLRAFHALARFSR